jgi:hypothetical protein
VVDATPSSVDRVGKEQKDAIGRGYDVQTARTYFFPVVGRGLGLQSSKGTDQTVTFDCARDETRKRSFFLTKHPLVAIGLVLGAIFLFTTTDGAAKYLTGVLPTEQIIWMRYVVGSMILAPILLHRRADGLLRTRPPGLHVLRGLLLMTSGLLFATALGLRSGHFRRITHL